MWDWKCPPSRKGGADTVLTFIKWYWPWWKFISVKGNHVSLHTKNIKTFVMKHPWLLYSMKLTKKAFLYENGLGTFSNICTDVLEKHAPRKKRYLRVNRKPFINPEISKAIMTRTRLRNCVLKKRNKNRVIL